MSAINAIPTMLLIGLLVGGCAAESETPSQSESTHDLEVLNARISAIEKSLAETREMIVSDLDANATTREKVEGIEKALMPVLLDRGYAGGGSVSTSTFTQSSSAERQSTTSSSLPLEATSVSAAITEKNDTWWRFAYKVSVMNNTGRRAKASIKVRFVDGSGYEIDSSPIYEQIAAGSRTLTGSTLVNVPQAQRVARVIAQLDDGNEVSGPVASTAARVSSGTASSRKDAEPDVLVSSVSAKITEMTKYHVTYTYSISAYLPSPGTARASFTVNLTDRMGNTIKSDTKAATINGRATVTDTIFMDIAEGVNVAKVVARWKGGEMSGTAESARYIRR